jgi:hypothetical protein
LRRAISCRGFAPPDVESVDAVLVADLIAKCRSQIEYGRNNFVLPCKPSIVCDASGLASL